MTKFNNKSPLNSPEFRYLWWLDYTNFLKETASKLEDNLSGTFRYNRYGEEPDKDAAAVNLILNGLRALIDVAQIQTEKSEKNLSQYNEFYDYWVFGLGEWNGLQEFLAKEEC